MSEASNSEPEPQKPNPKSAGSSPGSRGHRWTFLSNHAHLLLCLARDPQIRMRDVAERIGITERAVLNLLADLESEGVVQRRREGRRNVYDLSLDQPLRHPIERHRSIADLVNLILN